MTAILPLASAIPSGTMAQSPVAPTEEPAISFADLLDPAPVNRPEPQPKRMFAFSELGMFGRHGAQFLPVTPQGDDVTPDVAEQLVFPENSGNMPTAMQPQMNAGDVYRDQVAAVLQVRNSNAPRPESQVAMPPASIPEMHLISQLAVAKPQTAQPRDVEINIQPASKTDNASIDSRHLATPLFSERNLIETARPVVDVQVVSPQGVAATSTPNSEPPRADSQTVIRSAKPTKDFHPIDQPGASIPMAPKSNTRAPIVNARDAGQIDTAAHQAPILERQKPIADAQPARQIGWAPNSSEYDVLNLHEPLHAIVDIHLLTQPDAHAQQVPIPSLPSDRNAFEPAQPAENFYSSDQSGTVVQQAQNSSASSQIANVQPVNQTLAASRPVPQSNASFAGDQNITSLQQQAVNVRAASGQLHSTLNVPMRQVDASPAPRPVAAQSNDQTAQPLPEASAHVGTPSSAAALLSALEQTTVSPRQIDPPPILEGSSRLAHPEPPASPNRTANPVNLLVAGASDALMIVARSQGEAIEEAGKLRRLVEETAAEFGMDVAEFRLNGLDTAQSFRSIAGGSHGSRTR